MFRAHALPVSCALLTCLSAFGCGTAAADTESDPVPRYRFEVGQELTYESSRKFKYGERSLDRNATWRIWVVKQNADGSSRLILEHSATSPGQESSRIRFAYCDVTPEGQIAPNETIGFLIDPAELLIHLPRNEGELEQGWNSKDEGTGITRIYRARPADDAGKSVVEFEKKSLMDEIYESTNTGTAQFDRARGLVAVIEGNSSQGYGLQGKGTGHTELKSVEKVDPDRIAELHADSERYFDATAQYEKLTERAQRESDQTDKLLEDAVAVLNAADAAITSTAFKDALKNKLDSHKAAAEYVRGLAEKWSQLSGQPSPEWDATDFDGSSHSIAQYRGKVVVLDFWYRGCGWCIRAMPQVRQVAEAFEGRPVAVLGMNTDRNQDDARFVIDKMDLNYTNLKAEGLPEKYGVSGFPTLIIIDQEGRVSDIHIGYTPTLRTAVSESITRLLERKQ